LGTGSVVLQANNASVNAEHLGIAGGITLANNITIEQGNAGTIGTAGAIQYLTNTSGSATLGGVVTLLADSIAGGGGTFAGPVNGSDVLNVNGAVIASGTATTVSVASGSVAFGAGGNYQRLTVFGNALINTNDGIPTNAILNVFAPGVFDAVGH